MLGKSAEMTRVKRADARGTFSSFSPSCRGRDNGHATAAGHDRLGDAAVSRRIAEQSSDQPAQRNLPLLDGSSHGVSRQDLGRVAAATASRG